MSGPSTMWLAPLGKENKIGYLPGNISLISGPALLTYLEEKYPHTKFFIPGYLSVFLQLPLELIQLVAHFCSVRTRALLCQANKAFEVLFLPMLYEKAKDLPPSLGEIIRDISIRHNTLVCSEYESSACIVIATGINSDYVENKANIGFLPEDHQPNGYLVDIRESPVRICREFPTKKMSVDLFSERFILERRGNMIKHNKDYVSEQIEQRYDQTFASSTDKQKFALCFMAHICDKRDTEVVSGLYPNVTNYVNAWIDTTKKTFAPVLI